MLANSNGDPPAPFCLLSDNELANTETAFVTSIMFSLRSLSSATAAADAGDSSALRDALSIAAAVAGLIMLLLVLRFCFDILIDACVLGETNRARRTMSELWRKLCPWWKRRVAEEDSVPGNRTLGIPTSNPQSILASADFESRVELAMKVLRSEIVTPEGLKRAHTLSGGNETADSIIMCSICLHELVAGDSTLTAGCNHVYHRQCLMEWMASYARTDCPNCRTDVFQAQPEM